MKYDREAEQRPGFCWQGLARKRTFTTTVLTATVRFKFSPGCFGSFFQYERSK